MIYAQTNSFVVSLASALEPRRSIRLPRLALCSYSVTTSRTSSSGNYFREVFLPGSLLPFFPIFFVFYNAWTIFSLRYCPQSLSISQSVATSIAIFLLLLTPSFLYYHICKFAQRHLESSTPISTPHHLSHPATEPSVEKWALYSQAFMFFLSYVPW